MNLDQQAGERSARQCPRCRGTLTFTNRLPVLTVEARADTGLQPGQDRLRYETAWVCRDPKCDYREVVAER
jgi:hypothetical protein